MRNLVILAAVIVAGGLWSLFAADSVIPRMERVEPGIAQAGDTLKVTGENLDRANVKALYLTDGKKDTQVIIIEESASHILFQVPTGTVAGRLALMVLTAGETPKLIEEPVKVTIQ